MPYIIEMSEVAINSGYSAPSVWWESIWYHFEDLNPWNVLSSPFSYTVCGTVAVTSFACGD